jgi:cell division protein FtsB
MQDKIKQILRHPKAAALNDTRVLGLLAFGVIALLVTWSGIKSIQTNYELQKQISELTQQNNVKKLENTNLKLRNQYFKTDSFLELAARRQFGKAAPGEKVYVVPKSVALANSIEIAKPKDVKAEREANKPTYQKNLEAWRDFFFHHQQDK